MVPFFPSVRLFSCIEDSLTIDVDIQYNFIVLVWPVYSSMVDSVDAQVSWTRDHKSGLKRGMR